MPRISIHDVDLEAVLDEPIYDPKGRILLKKGAPLTPTLLLRLERWCITRVSVRRQRPERSSALAKLWFEFDDFDQFVFSDDPTLNRSAESEIVERAVRRWRDDQLSSTSDGTTEGSATESAAEVVA